MGDYDMNELECVWEVWEQEPDHWQVTVYDEHDKVIEERKEDKPLVNLWDEIGCGMALRYIEPEDVQKMRDSHNRRQNIKLVVDNG